MCKHYRVLLLQPFLSKLHKLSYVSFSFFLYIPIPLLHFVLLISPHFLNCDAQTYILCWALLTVHFFCNSLQLPMPYAKTEILWFYSYSWFLPKGNHLHLLCQLANFKLFLQIKKSQWGKTLLQSYKILIPVTRVAWFKLSVSTVFISSATLLMKTFNIRKLKPVLAEPHFMKLSKVDWW